MTRLVSQKIMQRGNDLKSSFATLRSTPGLIIAKDLKSRYSVISDDYAQLLGWKNADQCTDLTDYDIPCEASKAAEQFVELDQKAIQSAVEVLSLYICHYSLGWKTLLSSKKPIQKDDGEVTGILGQVIDISCSNLFRWCLSLNASDRKLVNLADKPTIYILNNEHSPLPLTERQQSCVFLLVRGKLIKEIASILEISARTVEEHIVAIKTKLGCNSRSQIIEKAISSGFLHYIPEDILQKKIRF